MSEVLTLLPLLERELGPVEGAPVALSGGITNRNFRARLGGRDYVVRLCGKDTGVLGIVREAEVRAARLAHTLGLAPEPVLFLPDEGVVVTRFVAGRAAQAHELRRPAVLARIAAALRAFHAGPPLPASFSAFRLGEAYRDETLARGGSVPAAFAEAKALADRVESVLGHPEHDPVPCHNDLLTANFILTADDGVRLVDWEYAGMGDRYFDLGNLAVNNGFGEDDDRRLLHAYFGPGDPAEERRRFAALRLMRLMSDYREATWGVVQGAVSELDFDYATYADEHFARLLEGASDPRLEEWLHAASA